MQQLKVNAMTYLDLENVIIGKLIPAGTGMRRYSDVQYDKTSAPVADVTEDVEITE